MPQTFPDRDHRSGAFAFCHRNFTHMLAAMRYYHRMAGEEDNRVVSVITANGSGSGYVIARDGTHYLLTAVHVTHDLGSPTRPETLRSFPLQRSEGADVEHLYLVGDGRGGYALARLRGFMTLGVTCEGVASTATTTDRDVSVLELYSPSASREAAQALLAEDRLLWNQFGSRLLNSAGLSDDGVLLPNPLTYRVIEEPEASEMLQSGQVIQLGLPAPYALEIASGNLEVMPEAHPNASEARDGLRVMHTREMPMPRPGFSGGPAFGDNGIFIGQTVAIFPSMGMSEIVSADTISEALDAAQNTAASPQPERVDLCDANRPDFTLAPNLAPNVRPNPAITRP